MATRIGGNQPRPVQPPPAAPAEAAALATAPQTEAAEGVRPRVPSSSDAYVAPAPAPKNEVELAPALPKRSEPRPMGPGLYDESPVLPESLVGRLAKERSAADVAESNGKPRWAPNAAVPLTVEDDGAYINQDGSVLPASIDVDDVIGLRPSDGSEPINKTVFINGVAQNRGQMAGMMQQIADMTGTEVVGLYNATEGWLKDAVQTVGDRLDLGDNAAVESLKNVMLDQIRDGDPLRVVGYSQGSVIASRAIQDVKDVLAAEGMSEADIQAKLRDLIQVETFATAHSHFPDGPAYVHHMNRFDPITLFSFYALGENSPFVDPGDDAAVHWFNSSPFKNPHSLNTYEKNHQTFEELFKGDE
jgi:hypothetical protein